MEYLLESYLLGFLLQIIDFFLLQFHKSRVFIIHEIKGVTCGSGEQLNIKTSNAIGFRYRRAEVS